MPHIILSATTQITNLSSFVCDVQPIHQTKDFTNMNKLQYRLEPNKSVIHKFYLSSFKSLKWKTDGYAYLNNKEAIRTYYYVKFPNEIGVLNANAKIEIGRDMNCYYYPNKNSSEFIRIKPDKVAYHYQHTNEGWKPKTMYISNEKFNNQEFAFKGTENAYDLIR